MLDNNKIITKAYITPNMNTSNLQKTFHSCIILNTFHLIPIRNHILFLYLYKFALPIFVWDKRINSTWAHEDWGQCWVRTSRVWPDVDVIVDQLVRAGVTWLIDDWLLTPAQLCTVGFCWTDSVTSRLRNHWTYVSLRCCLSSNKKVC